MTTYLRGVANLSMKPFSIYNSNDHPTMVSPLLFLPFPEVLRREKLQKAGFASAKDMVSIL